MIIGSTRKHEIGRIYQGTYQKELKGPEVPITYMVLRESSLKEYRIENNSDLNLPDYFYHEISTD